MQMHYVVENTCLALLQSGNQARFVGQMASSARDPLVALLRPTGLRRQADRGVGPTKIVAACKDLAV